jgi:hypothetical protein
MNNMPMEVIPTDPIIVEKSIRRDTIRVLTSSNAGRIVPVAVIPMLREDRVSTSRIRLAVEMMETVELLENGINVTAYAHFVPHLALDRFKSMDELNRSYQGVAGAGGSVVPYFQTMTFDRNADFWKTLGVHAVQGSTVNAAPVEYYNEIVNFRRRSRSEKLALRTALDTTLAPAFWKHSDLQHIVPDFDQAMIDGEVTLNIIAQNLPVRGIGVENTASVGGGVSVRETGGTSNITYAHAYNANSTTSGNRQWVKAASAAVGAAPEIFAELGAQGVKLSLQNIELAKKTAAFAQMRERFAGIGDDALIDLLMEGIRVPDEAMKQPILLDKKSTLIGYNRRWATDAANLAKDVTTGETFLDLTLRTPPMNTGGAIIITVEVVPEQLFERRADVFVNTTNPANLPNFMRDFLDPEKVSVVRNSYVDVLHATPNGTFGYAPLNHEWNRDLVRIGGKFQRGLTDTFNEDRQRMWVVEQLNPSLTADFYMCSALHQKVFADQVAHAFEYKLRGEFEIIGNTVFGKGLIEKANNDFSEIDVQVDKTRITQ